jgi:CrcB protein
MYKILLIGAAGLVGTLARHWLSAWADRQWGGPFPMGTLVVNLTGCLAVGFLLMRPRRGTLSIPPGAAVFIGLLGGFTTFSSFGLQTFSLFRDGEILLAANILISNVAGLMLVWTGYAISRMW